MLCLANVQSGEVNAPPGITDFVLRSFTLFPIEFERKIANVPLTWNKSWPGYQ